MIPDKIKVLALDVDGVLTDGGIYVSEKGDVSKKFNVKDGIGIRLAIKAGVDVWFISAGKKSAKLLKIRAQMLGVQYFYSGDVRKTVVFEKFLERTKVSPKEVAYIGDDVNDLELFSAAGFSACPSDAVTEVKKKADVVLSRKGGDACVREFIDKFILKNE